MPSPESNFQGQQGRFASFDETLRLQFVISQMLKDMQTMTLVEVVAVSNDGGLSPVGTVDVRPMVNQMTGQQTSVPHGVIYKIPYFRIQGGTNAVIIDPQVGDIGMCGFCSRDISTVVATRKAALPASLRKYDWADGLYFGGFLNGVPVQYVRFADDGIEIASPTKVRIVAPLTEVEGDMAVSGGLTVGEGISADSDITSGDISLTGHIHGGVQTGGGTTGQPQ